MKFVVFIKIFNNKNYYFKNLSLETFLFNI